MKRSDVTLERLSAAARAYGDAKRDQQAATRAWARENPTDLSPWTERAKSAESELLAAARAHATRWRKRK